MQAFGTAGDPLYVAISAADEALCASLVLLLGAYGIRSGPFAHLGEVPVHAEARSVLMIDLQLLEQGGALLQEGIQRAGWPGVMIVMMEDERSPRPSLVIGSDRIRFLTKPFSSEELLALLSIC